MHKELRMKIMTLMVGICLFAGYSFNAEAARTKANNYIYLDASANPVGQDVVYCNNVHWVGGNRQSPYVLHVQGGCGELYQTCTSTGECTEHIDNEIKTTLTGSPPYTKQEACALTSQCASQEGDLMDGYGFEMTMVYP
jgi:hypothetical protein